MKEDKVSFKKNKRIECADGFSMSVQASGYSYCMPRINDAPSYDEVEVGFPNAYDSLLAPYAEDAGDYTGTVYGYVPANIIVLLCIKHGGVVSGELPSGIPLIPRAE